MPWAPSASAPGEAFLISCARDCYPKGRDPLARRAQHVKLGSRQRTRRSRATTSINVTAPCVLLPAFSHRSSADGGKCLGTPPLRCGRCAMHPPPPSRGPPRRPRLARSSDGGNDVSLDNRRTDAFGVEGTLQSRWNDRKRPRTLEARSVERLHALTSLENIRA